MPDTPPINLTHLRELPSNLIAGQPYATVNVPAYTLLALIDTAEAATVIANNPIGDNVLIDCTTQVPIPRWQLRKLRATLARYTTE